MNPLLLRTDKMNQLIKQRITQLNNGEIPNGYKKTSVGIVPIEWTEHTLGDIFKFKNGINKEKEAFGQGTPIVNYTDVWKKRGLKAEDIKGRVVLSKNEIQNYEVKCGDVFFTRTSETIEEIGYSSVLLDDIENAIFSGFVLRARPYNNLVSREYHQYCYSEPQMRHEIIKRSSMTTRALTSGPMLSQVAINLPSHREQSKIAEILMKWDEAIELQKHYITKIILRNGAVVDKLLSSKDNWRPLPLSTFVELKNGYAFKSEKYINEGKYKIITIKNVKSGEFDLTECCTIDELPNNLQTHQLLSMGDIIISLTGNVGRACIVNAENCLLNQRVGKIVVKTISPVFVYEILQTNRFVSKMKNIAQGCAQANLSNADVEDFVAFFPYDGDSLDIKTIDKISCILSEFRNELALQKELLNKLLLQRKVLQQYLLNGIVRVKV